MDFNNLYRRNILEPMEKAKLTWYGWHAFRRGLASNLFDLGVPDPVIQQIFRHADVTTTEKFYRKVRRPAVTKARKKLSKQLSVVNESGNREFTSDKQRTAKKFR